MARLGRAQPRGVFVPTQRPRTTANHNVVTATDTIAALSETATRASKTSLTAADTLATLTDTATRLLSLPRTASDTEATLTDTATRAAQHFTRTAADTETTVTDTPTRISKTTLTASDTEAALSDAVTRAASYPRTASDTVAAVTDAATRAAEAFIRTATDVLFALSDSAFNNNTPIVYTYVPAPPGWQPWNVPGTYNVTQWDSEVYQGGGLGDPPPVNTAVLCAQVAMGTFTLKVWMLATEVTPSG